MPLIDCVFAEVSVTVEDCTPGAGTEEICVSSAWSCFCFWLTELFDDQIAVERPAIVTRPRMPHAIRRPFCGERVIGAAPPRATGLSGGRRLTAFMSVLDPEADRDEHAGGAVERLEVVGDLDPAERVGRGHRDAEVGAEARHQPGDIDERSGEDEAPHGRHTLLGSVE